jgi:multisubunit Na+/H+ antiporter MnhB subunit
MGEATTIHMLPLSLRPTGAISLAAFLLCLACAPVVAHNATEMGVAPDQFDQGIPIYWPYHAALLTVGLLFLLSGFIVMRYRRTSHGFQNHQRLQALGGLAAVAGISMSIYMVQLSGAPHFHAVHDVLGVGTVAVILVTLGLGVVVTRTPGISRQTRSAHRLLGMAAIALVAANIVLGLSMLPSVLAQ